MEWYHRTDSLALATLERATINIFKTNIYKFDCMRKFVEKL